MPRPDTLDTRRALATRSARDERNAPETRSTPDERSTLTALRDRIAFDAIGTTWSITTAEPLEPAVTAAVLDRIDAFDEVWSRFRDDSLVSTVARSAGRYAFPAEAGALFDLYSMLGRATGGRVNPLVGRRLENLGYGPDYRLVSSTGPADVSQWNSIPQWNGVPNGNSATASNIGETPAAAWTGTHLTTTEPVLVDVGAAGKGYLVDLVCDVLRDAGVETFVVDASGDLRAEGDVPARVALEHPADPSLAIGVVELKGAALCASATNRRTWGEGLHHVIDAVTGEPTRDVIATWALAPTALEADGLATALFFASHTDLVSHGVDIDFESLRMHADGRVEATPLFEAVLFR